MMALAGPISAYVSVTGLDGSVREVPTRGCAAAARSAIYGSVRRFISVAEFPAYLFRFGNQIYADPAVKAALSAYSDCMKRSGYAATGPAQAFAAAQVRFGTPSASVGPPTPAANGRGTSSSPVAALSRTVSQAERAMAVTDATCQTTSRLASAWDEAGFSAASTWIRGHRAALLALAKIQRRSVLRARMLLSRG